MVRNSRNNKYSKSRRTKSNSRKVNRRSTLANSYQALETRHLLAFLGFFDGITLDVIQTADDGMVTIDNNGGGNAFQATDGSGTATFVAATNLVVDMLDGTGNELDLDLVNAHTGDVELNLGDGTRAVNFTGTGNAIDGSLTVTAGNEDQTLEIAVNNTLTVGGNLAFDLGTGNDVVDEDNNDIAIAGNWDFVGVNFFENGGVMTVGGNVTVDSTGEIDDTVFDDDNTMTITGDYTYNGGDGRDESTMNGVGGGTSIGGNAFVDVGDNTVGGVQFIFFNLPNASIAGTLDVISTSSANIDSFSLHPSGNFGGDINVDLGDGTNDAGFSGAFGGSNVTYRGGDGTDTVFYGMTGNLADVNAIMGAGDDVFSLGAGATISPTTLRVDYGGGVDTFINGYGQFDFNAAFLNMDNFNRFYTESLDQWNMVQLADDGDVTLVTNGGIVELTNTYSTSMSPATNVRLNMLNNSTSHVAVNLDSPLAGDLILDLMHGDRNIDFTGLSNSIGGNLIVEAADGNQNVELAVNNPLTVGGAAVFNLRNGVDVVDDDGNDISVAGSMIFRGVNSFESEGTVNVGAMLMNTASEVEQSRLDNDGTMNIAGSLIYIGGDAKDDIILNDGVSVGGNVSLDVGPNMDIFPGQSINLSGFNALSSVYVFGGESFGGNSFLSDAATTIGGIFVVDFRDNSAGNLAVIDGNFGGNLGIYRGGSGADVVSMDEVAGDMDFFLLMGAGDDTFNLGINTLLDFLWVNFGDDFDTLNDEFFGIYPFATAFWGLP